MDTRDGFGQTGIYILIVVLLGVFGFIYYEMMHATEPGWPTPVNYEATTTSKTTTTK